MNAIKFVPLCLVLAIAFALVPAIAPNAAAVTTVTGTWSITTYSGDNQTSTFSYPETINATLTPLNISVSGQRTVSITDGANTSHIYFSTSIGFYPAGTNSTAGRVNVSWAIPQTFEDGGVLQLSVGLAGVKTPESSVILTIKQNLANAVMEIIAPFISAFQGQLNSLQQQLSQEKLARADDNFHNQQIEAIMGIAIACMIAYIVYDKRKRSGAKEEYERAAGEFEQVVIGTAMENSEPGERARVEAAANGGAAEGKGV